MLYIFFFHHSNFVPLLCFKAENYCACTPSLSRVRELYLSPSTHSADRKILEEIPVFSECLSILAVQSLDYNRIEL